MQKRLLKATLHIGLLGVFLLIGETTHAATFSVTCSTTGTTSLDCPTSVTYSGNYSGAFYQGRYPSITTPFGSYSTTGAINAHLLSDLLNPSYNFGTALTSNGAGAGDYWFSACLDGTGTTCPSGLYYTSFYWDGAGTVTPITTPTATTWIAPYTPATNTYQATTSRLFSAQYFFNCDISYGILDQVTFEFRNLSGGPNPSVTASNISICGTATLSKQVGLIASTTYMWRPVMTSSTGSSTALIGEWYTFTTQPQPSDFTPNTAANATLGTSTLVSTTNLLSFLNVPQLLSTKVPFGYFFEAKDSIETAISSSTPIPVPSGTFSIRIGDSTTTVDMFSTTTVSYFLSAGTISTLRSLMVAALYIEFLYLLYHRAKSTKLI